MFVITVLVSLVLAVCSISASPSMRTIDIGEGYIVGEEWVDHNVATSLCDFAGKTLASIETMEKDILIHSLLKNAGVTDYVWTSGRNNGGDRNIWRWGNGTPFYYSRWHLGQPLNDGDFCLVLDTESYDRVWHSWACTHKLLPLCEGRPIVQAN